MRFRRVELTGGGTSAAVWDQPAGRWLPLVPAVASTGPTQLAPLADDLIALLAGGERLRDTLASLIDASSGHDYAAEFTLTPLMPFQPKLVRAFANFERHWVQGARGLVRIGMPRALPLIRAVETITRRPFKLFRPGKLFYEEPAFYLGNPLTVIPSGAEAPWPAYTDRLDFELELAAVIVKPVLDATPERAAEAIGGFAVFNDLSARDTQWRELRDGLFGPVIKTKTFASAISCEIVSADEIAPRLRELRGEVVVNGETWSTTSTADLRRDFGEMASFASAGEQLQPGELLSSGTLPDGCGLELGRWIQPGDVVELKIEGVGSVVNTIGSRQSQNTQTAAAKQTDGGT